MRVSDGRARPREAGDRRARGFGDALREARRGAEGGEDRDGGAAGAVALAAAVRRAAAGRMDDALRGRREGFDEASRGAEPQPPLVAARAAEPVATPELRAVVRTLPLAIQTFGLAAGAPLSLSFGRSLDVDLRAVPGGVELLLRPEPRLARAAAAELGGVVAALGAKGITVARAEVRPRHPQRPAAAAPRVDLPPAVR